MVASQVTLAILWSMVALPVGSVPDGSCQSAEGDAMLQQATTVKAMLNLNLSEGVGQDEEDENEDGEDAKVSLDGLEEGSDAWPVFSPTPDSYSYTFSYTVAPTPAPTPACSPNEVHVEVRLVIDEQLDGRDTTWQIRDKTNNLIIASGDGSSVMKMGGYGGSHEDIVSSECLPSSVCADFTISDRYCEGLCCKHSNGFYTVEVNGNRVVTGGDFGCSETTTIITNCAPTPAPPTYAPTPGPTATPTSASLCQMPFETNSRCSGKPPGSWGDLGGKLTEAECTNACLVDTACQFAVYRIRNGICTRFDACDLEDPQINGGGPWTIWAKDQASCQA